MESGLMVIKRTGETIDYNPGKIRIALGKAIKASGAEDAVTSEQIDKLLTGINLEVEQRFRDFCPNVENIQDIAEKHLLKNGFYGVAKRYILYRSEREKIREKKKEDVVEKARHGKITVDKGDRKELFDVNKVREAIIKASKGYEADISVDLVTNEVLKNIYEGITTKDIEKVLVLSAVPFIEKDPAYNFVAARLFLDKIYNEVLPDLNIDAFDKQYRQTFVEGIHEGIRENLLDKKLMDFDLEKLANSLKLERDNLLKYMGIQTLNERYLLRVDQKKIIETPQACWMRISMGLSLNEENKEERAIEFYEILSSLKFVSSTPTLFNSGTVHPQLSSCYLTTIKDDLHHIFKCMGDNAQMSKWAGGIANDWTYLRSTGSIIKKTQNQSQGVVPFMKISNDIICGVARTGKRRSGTCAYLESWHLDVEDFLDLRKNTGDERRRTHELNTANWIPDLFMKRVESDETWTLFSPDETLDLHDLYGTEFEKKYLEYEDLAKRGKMHRHKTVSALKLWKRMLSMLFETGHPWITFKDPCNIRSPQDHVGVIHSSNLCTEITLNTNGDETAVCNLGSINLSEHIVDGKFDVGLVARTLKSAIRMLDNVIDLNFYPTIEGKNSNMRHRPIGLGVMGLQDALFKLSINYDSPAAIEFSDKSQEVISYFALLTSSEIAKEKGFYPSYKGSKWDRGIFPDDTIDMLEEQRGLKTGVSREVRLDWSKVRDHVKEHGIRNSNVMAIAPTATISNVAGCFPCIEPIYKNIYVKANMFGEFTIVNEYLVNDLKKQGLWNQDMLDQLKYYDGNLQSIETIPQEIKDKHKEAFEIDPKHCIDMTAARGRWIDQSQSHNVFFQGVSGTRLHDIYTHAWKKGLKTTYYLRSMGATQIEKSTLDASKFGSTQKREYKDSKSEEIKVDIVETQPGTGPKLCSIMDPECEACQ